MEESISNSMFSRESYGLTNLIGSADAPLLYGFGSLSFSFPFFPFVSAVLDLEWGLRKSKLYRHVFVMNYLLSMKYRESN